MVCVQNENLCKKERLAVLYLPIARMPDSSPVNTAAQK
jgi:hypothetical protein